jgi:hypothetical protein
MWVFVAFCIDPSVVSNPVQLLAWYPTVTAPPTGTEIQAGLVKFDCEFCSAWALVVLDSLSAVAVVVAEQELPSPMTLVQQTTLLS